MFKKILKFVCAIVLLLGITSAALLFQIYKTGRTDSAGKADAIAVLGAAEYAGRPSPVFQARLDHAYDLFQRGLAPTIITTGGTFEGENYSEGEVGKTYLVKEGIPESAIIAETQSLTTKQNIMRIADISREQKFSQIILVSDPFHLYRAKIIAGDAGLNVFTSPAGDSPIEKNTPLKWWYMGRELLLVYLHILFDV